MSSCVAFASGRSLRFGRLWAVLSLAGLLEASPAGVFPAVWCGCPGFEPGLFAGRLGVSTGWSAGFVFGDGAGSAAEVVFSSPADGLPPRLLSNSSSSELFAAGGDFLPLVSAAAAAPEQARASKPAAANT